MAPLRSVFSPMLAVSLEAAGSFRFPLFASPKLDGMRASITERGPVTRASGTLVGARASS
jgi:hypothetical protein